MKEFTQITPKVTSHIMQLCVSVSLFQAVRGLDGIKKQQSRGPLPVFVNKTLLELSHICLHSVYSDFHIIMTAEWLQHKLPGPQSLKYLSLVLYRSLRTPGLQSRIMLNRSLTCLRHTLLAESMLHKVEILVYSVHQCTLSTYDSAQQMLNKYSLNK